MNQYILLSELPNLLKDSPSVVLNVEASWCPDCTRHQRPNLKEFASKLAENGIEFYQLVVQEERRVFLSSEHEDFVNSVGGHGYPRTVFYHKGNLESHDHVEVITATQLNDLVGLFVSIPRDG